MHPATPSPRTRRAVAAAIGVIAIVVAARLVRLDTLPGEWYGDISTLYEYADQIRNGELPPQLYVVGVGPLYPLIAAVPLSLGGATSYPAFKLLGVLLSLAGLAALYTLARRLHPDRRFAWLAVFVAGTGSWFLTLSRLGDLHPLPFLLATTAVALAVALDTGAPHSRARAVGCGVVAAAGLYAYGATFVLPAVVAAIVLTGWLQGRIATVDALAFALALAAVAAPLAGLVLTHWPEIRGGHFGRAAAASVAEIAGNTGRALLAYFTRGDVIARNNPGRLPHLDAASAAALLAGVCWWLQAPRRAAGTIVVGAFLALHLQSVATAAISVPSAGRTIAAAPFAYLLVAGGLWWGYDAARRHLSPRTAGAALAFTAGLIAAINLHRYFVVYPAGLPWANTEVARPIDRLLDAMPRSVHAYLVDPGWGPQAIPEMKSVRYGATPRREVDEIAGVELDCARLAALDRPGVLIWRPAPLLPSTKLCACAGALRADLHVSPGGVPIFRSASIPPRDAAPTTCPAGVAVNGAEPAAAPQRSVITSPPVEAVIATSAGALRVRHPPLDMGNPADIFDRNESTLMRGARDNPFTFELAYPQPIAVAAIDFLLGYMPHYEIAATVADADGHAHDARGVYDGTPGTAQRPHLTFRPPVRDAVAIRVTIDDVRPPPPEGAHIHVYEMAVR